MKKLLLINPLRLESSYKSLFQKDPNADLVVIVQEKIYSLHREVLKGILYFQTKTNPKQKVHIIQADLDNDVFEQILSYFYGFDLSFERNAKIFQVLRMVKFLGVKEIQQKIVGDFTENFDEYGIFCLMEISNKLNLELIYQRCINELIELRFEQILINKFDLLNCEKQFFARVIIESLKFQNELNMTGPSNEQICKIIKEYNEQNDTKIDFEVLAQASNQKNQNKLGQKIQSRLCRKRSSTWNCRKSVGEITQKENRTPNKTNWYKNGSWDEATRVNQSCSKKEQVFHLKMINDNLIKSSSAMKQQLQQFKSQLQSQYKNNSTEDDLDELEQRCIQLRKMSALHDQKFINLQIQVCKFSEELDKEQNQEKSLKDINFFEQLMMGGKNHRLRKASEPCFFPK